ncbi:MAG TPA: hypothetical protein VLI04_01225 [Nocardioidaceae bacterium]|nr:hypothetical protein [Nocardioidaceae bacterium]
MGTAGCGDDASPREPVDAESVCTGTVSAPPQDAKDYDPALFEAGSAHTNSWFPMRPGTRFFYRGSSLDEGERLHHTVDIIVTDLTKVVDGVRNVVVWERDYTAGDLVEAELALFTTDKHQNVWHMGEYPEEYEEGEFVAAPAWVHGFADACAGITIPGDPQLGSPDYAEGWAPPPIGWADRGRVFRTKQKTCVPAGCYKGVVVIEEFENGLPDAFQDKHYAPGLGVVRVGWRGSNDESKEVLELVRVTQLDASQLARVRKQALELEERALTRSKDVWAKTEPSG